MNMQCSLIRELMLYKFVLGLNTAKAIKKICCVEGEGIVTRLFKKISLGLQESCQSERPKTMDSKTVFQP